jgi:hypothetical protein
MTIRRKLARIEKAAARPRRLTPAEYGAERERYLAACGRWEEDLIAGKDPGRFPIGGGWPDAESAREQQLTHAEGHAIFQARCRGLIGLCDYLPRTGPKGRADADCWCGLFWNMDREGLRPAEAGAEPLPAEWERYSALARRSVCDVWAEIDRLGGVYPIPDAAW